MTSEVWSPLRVSDKPDSSSTAAHSQTGWVNLNCVTFIDESAQCFWDRGGAPSPAERCNAPIEEDTDGQPSSTARRPVPRNGMSVKRKPKRKYNIRGKGQRRSVSRLIFLCFYWGVSGWFSLVKTWAPDRRYPGYSCYQLFVNSKCVILAKMVSKADAFHLLLRTSVFKFTRFSAARPATL